jgi:hypothetical protein
VRAAAGIVTARPQLLDMIGGALINLLPDSAHHIEKRATFFHAACFSFFLSAFVTVCAVCFRGATTRLGACERLWHEHEREGGPAARLIAHDACELGRRIPATS